MTQQQKWLAAFWRWFLEALDRGDWGRALELGEVIEKIKRGQTNDKRHKSR